jgi:hypothetical protein
MRHPFAPNSTRNGGENPRGRYRFHCAVFSHKEVDKAGPVMGPHNPPGIKIFPKLAAFDIILKDG